jgi:SAM-dependent methyltransferase
MDRLIFAQHNAGNQLYFLSHCGQYHTVPLRQFPHYLFLTDCLDDPYNYNHVYSQYLRASWLHLYGRPPTQTEINVKIDGFLELYKEISHRENRLQQAKSSISSTSTAALSISTEAERVLNTPVLLCPRFDDRFLIVDGNHRSAIALKLGLPLPVKMISPQIYLGRLALRVGGTLDINRQAKQLYAEIMPKRLNKAGPRARSELMDLVDQADLAGKSVLDISCGLGKNCFIAASRGAKSVLGVDSRSYIVDAALRINGLLTLPATFLVRGTELPEAAFTERDTTICFLPEADAGSHADILALQDLTMLVSAGCLKTLYFAGFANTTIDEFIHFPARLFQGGVIALHRG